MITNMEKYKNVHLTMKPKIKNIQKIIFKKL